MEVLPAAVIKSHWCIQNKGAWNSNTTWLFALTCSTSRRRQRSGYKVNHKSQPGAIVNAKANHF